MKGYSAKIVESSRELTPKERIMLKDTSNAIKLDEACAGAEVTIEVDMYATVGIHNENSENKDYEVYLIIDKNGTKFVTGSESFITTFTDIMNEMLDAGETDVTIVAYKKDSKNYKGKQFITCSIL